VRRIDERIGEMKPMLFTIYNISVCAILVFLFDATDQPVSFRLLVKAIVVLCVVLLAQAALILGPFAQEKMQKHEDPTSPVTSNSTSTGQDGHGVSKLSKENAELRAQVTVLKMEIQMLQIEKEPLNGAAASSSPSVATDPLETKQEPFPRAANGAMVAGPPILHE
jgi:hypothetical protein